jgi:hypothetical protein
MGGFRDPAAKVATEVNERAVPALYWVNNVGK